MMFPAKTMQVYTLSDDDTVITTHEGLDNPRVSSQDVAQGNFGKKSRRHTNKASVLSAQRNNFHILGKNQDRLK